MRDYASDYAGRTFDVMFFADDEAFSIDPVQAFLCPPNDRDVRWVPEKGCTTTIGSRLFLTDIAATAKLKRDAKAERAELLKRMDKIEAFLGEKAAR